LLQAASLPSNKRVGSPTVSDKSSSYRKLVKIQQRAAFTVLKKHNKDILSSLAEKLEKELGKEEELKPESKLNDKLILRINYIKTALREKEKQEKSDQEQKSTSR
jgi:hypothetical protein